MEKIKQKIMKNKDLIFWLALTFIFYLITTTLTPLVSDDWGNYFVGKEGIGNIINHAIHTYFTWEGRFISRIILSGLSYYKILFNILLSILMTLGVYSIIKNEKIKNKKLVLSLSILSMLALDIGIQNQVIYWIAGSVTYLFPTMLILVYICCYINSKDTKKPLSICITGLFSFFIVMFVENIGACYVLINILFLYDKWRQNKKIDYKLLINLVISIIGLLIMYLSPGNRARLSQTDSQFNIFMQAIENYKNLIYYTFTKNAFLIMLLTIAGFLLVKSSKNKVLKIYYIITSIINFIIIILYALEGFTNIIKIDLVSNILLQIYWTIYGLIYLWIIITSKLNKKKEILFFIIVGLAANLVMLISPLWGNRTTFSTVVFLTIANIYIIDDLIKANKKSIFACNFLIIMAMILFIVMRCNIYLSNKYREKEIQNDISNNEEIITIYNNPQSWLLWTYNIKEDDTYHLETFKKYYNIENKEIEIKNTKWKYFIFFNSK